MSCGGVGGTVIKSLAMETRIGHVPLHQLQSSFIPWPEGEIDPDLGTREANDYWSIVGGFFGSINFEVEEDDGDLFLTPIFTRQNSTGGRYRAVFWIATEFIDDPGFYSMDGSELYFRVFPVQNPSGGGTPYTWLFTVQLYDFGESGDPDGDASSYILFQIGSGTPDFIYVESADFITDSDDDFWFGQENYDPDVHRWVRMRHVEANNTIVVETAPEACGSFTTLATLGPYDARLTSFSVEILSDVIFDEANPADLGIFGALNPEARQRELPLLTRVGDPKVPGDVIAELPLVTAVQPVSP